ncbi:MAG: hypothetical protein R2713_17505 [Ilumatobacteraceae bacterium]
MIPVVEPELGGPPTAPTGYVPAVAGRPRRRFGRLAPNLVLLASALFFTFPLLSLARFALQNVPTVLLGWDTLFDKWSISGITAVFDEPQFWESLRLSLKLALGTVFITLFLLLPTAIWVHLRVPKARAFVEFVTVLPYMVPAIALVAGIVVIKPHARWFLNPTCRSSRSTCARPALHLPVVRRRAEGDRSAHAGRRVAQPGRRMGRDGVPCARAQHALVDHLRIVPHGRGRDG